MKPALAEVVPPATGIGPGSVLDGKYLVGEIVGSGAFGIVYEAKNLELDEKVALKVMRPEAAVDKAMVGRFAREAKSAAAIKSEYVASVFDVGSKDGVPYIVMEFLDGRSLGAVVEDSGPFAARTAVEYGLQICEALAMAHSKGIIHRDIKPENLLLTERAGGMQIVKTMNLMGTPLYMSPEQVRCSDHVDVRSDIWSLGMVLYEILAGSTAFEGASIPEICAAILEMQPTPIEVHRNDLPAGLVSVISKCLEKDQNKRFQNVAELALALMPFGPKRSRLNVERAVTVLQGAGQVDPNLKIDSMLPPPSSEAISTLTPRIMQANMPTISEVVSAHDAGLPSTAAPPETLGSAAQATGTSPKTKLAIAGGAIVLAIVGAAMLLSSSKVETPATPVATTTVAAAKQPDPAPTQTQATAPAAAPTDAPSDTHSAAPAHAAATVPAWARAPKPTAAGAGRAPATAAVAPPPATTTAAPPPPATTTAPPAQPAETATGRTFRRSL